jgi:hypothetical protein
MLYPPIVDRLGRLNLIPDLLQKQAPAAALLECVRASKLPRDVTEEEWLWATKIVGDAAAADLSWMSDDSRKQFLHRCTDFVRRAFVNSWPGVFIAESKLTDALLPFVQWLETQKDSTVLYFAWDLLAATWRGEAHADYSPVSWMARSGRLKGEISFENLELAVALAEESDVMYWWPEERWSVVRWSRESQPYVELLNHGSYLVRAAAADCLGEVFRGCSMNPCAEAAVPVASILEFIKQQEQKNAGVAGPFLMGAHWGMDWPDGLDHDYRSWFLDVLRTSEREPDVPHEQSLEFYAHEFFSKDADAIEEFIGMGRKKLALMTATESPEAIYELLPLLQRLAASDDPMIARAIKAYLADGRPHAGIALADD